MVSTLDLQSEYSEFNSHQRRCAIETKVLSSHLQAYAFFDAFKEGLATLAWNLFQDIGPFPAVRVLYNGARCHSDHFHSQLKYTATVSNI